MVWFEDENNQWVVREHIFGPKPKHEDVLHFIHHILPNLLQEQWLAQNECDEQRTPQKKISPKRMQRMINKEKQKRRFLLNHKMQSDYNMKQKNK
nr:DUF2992 family protein [Vagococcus silagei]